MTNVTKITSDKILPTLLEQKQQKYLNRFGPIEVKYQKTIGRVPDDPRLTNMLRDMYLQYHI